MAAETLRLFIALPCPAALTGRLTTLSHELDSSDWQLSFTPPEQFHLTLHFLGPTPARLLEDLGKELSAWAHARRAFDLRLGGLDVFPNWESPRVLWTGFSGQTSLLQELYGSSRRLLSAKRLFDLPADYVPHLTLARVQDLRPTWDPSRVQALLPQWQDLGTFSVEKVQLIQSILRPEGAKHQILREFKLGSS